jgi:cell division protein FtsB
MKLFLGLLVTVLLLLQYRLWLSEDGLREVVHLRDAVAAQQAENATLGERNGQLAAEVVDLRSGNTALEERARNDLGMVGTHETFYQVVPTGGAPLPAAVPGQPDAAPSPGVAPAPLQQATAP